MTTFIYGLLCGTLLGACCALIYAMLRTPRKPRGITKFARMTRAENPVEIASAAEIRRRMWRDGPIEPQEVGGIDYRFLGQTGHEMD